MRPSEQNKSALAFEDNKKLRLMAEMRLPGREWLEFEVERSDSGAVIRQTAIFDPLGALGLAYWHLLYLCTV